MIKTQLLLSKFSKREIASHKLRCLHLQHSERKVNKSSVINYIEFRGSLSRWSGLTMSLRVSGTGLVSASPAADIYGGHILATAAIRKWWVAVRRNQELKISIWREAVIGEPIGGQGVGLARVCSLWRTDRSPQCCTAWRMVGMTRYDQPHGLFSTWPLESGLPSGVPGKFRGTCPHILWTWTFWH